MTYHWDPQLKMGTETTRLMKAVWPNFILEESDLPGEPPRQARMLREELVRRMPLWGLRRGDGALAAYASGILIEADLTQNTFPDRGWTWAMETFFASPKVNCLCLLAANVDPADRGKGLAEQLLKQAKTVALNHGLGVVIGPVRPTAKAQFPQMSFEEYIMKRREDGDLYDPWLRLHQRLGGEILNICAESVVVKASLNRWKQWTGTSDTNIPGGLAPLTVEGQAGIYREPNVWVRYRLS